MSNANAEVYTETSTNVFNFQGLVASGNSLNVTIDNKNSVWVLVNPTANNAYAYVSAYASPYSSKSSSLSEGEIAAMVIWIIISILFHAYILGMFTLIFGLKRNRGKHNADNVDNKKKVVKDIKIDQENIKWVDIKEKKIKNINNSNNDEEEKKEPIKLQNGDRSETYLDKSFPVPKDQINSRAEYSTNQGINTNIQQYPKLEERYVDPSISIVNNQPVLHQAYQLPQFNNAPIVPSAPFPTVPSVPAKGNML